MSNRIQSNQNLNTVFSYTNALQNANMIEKAVQRIENGDRIVDFPKYSNAYITLMTQIRARNEQDIPKSLQAAHRQLTDKLCGLEKRVTAAISKVEAFNSSNSSFGKRLVSHVGEPVSYVGDHVRGPWPWKRITKYGVVGCGTLAFAFNFKNSASATLKIIKTAKTLFTNIPAFAKRVAEFTDGAAQAGSTSSKIAANVNAILPENTFTALGTYATVFFFSKFMTDAFTSVNKYPRSNGLALAAAGTQLLCSTSPETCNAAIQEANLIYHTAGDLASTGVSMASRFSHTAYNTVANAVQNAINIADNNLKTTMATALGLSGALPILINGGIMVGFPYVFLAATLPTALNYDWQLIQEAWNSEQANLISKTASNKVSAVYQEISNSWRRSLEMQAPIPFY